MNYCPNRHCPYRVKHGEPAEYRDHLVRCGDCGEELVESGRGLDLAGAGEAELARLAAVGVKKWTDCSGGTTTK